MIYLKLSLKSSLLNILLIIVLRISIITPIIEYNFIFEDTALYCMLSNVEQISPVRVSLIITIIILNKTVIIEYNMFLLLIYKYILELKTNRNNEIVASL
ncbi:hypothetical protein [Inconstantimicrobium mannanitabidum]|uniref:hypothetical protein n=1 Tax=Inconstantimicrobium mannanitabidum TaxID=1604901 RepID=UPI0021C3901F|nr:hypothetical protein [Clostridium sp. TW13]